MDEVSYLEPEANGSTSGADRIDDVHLDVVTIKSCLDFLFQAAVDQRMPLVASLIGAASDAVEDSIRQANR